MSAEEPPPFGGGVYIADKSAWDRARNPGIRAEWGRAMRQDRIRTCPIVKLELLYSARDDAEFQALEEQLAELHNVPITMSEFAAAQTAMRELAAQQPRFHRVSLPDTLIAAAAQSRGIGVLHYDRHYDRLKQVMNFTNRWIRPPGSIP